MRAPSSAKPFNQPACHTLADSNASQWMQKKTIKLRCFDSLSSFAAWIAISGQTIRWSIIMSWTLLVSLINFHSSETTTRERRKGVIGEFGPSAQWMLIAGAIVSHSVVPFARFGVDTEESEPGFFPDDGGTAEMSPFRGIIYSWFADLPTECLGWCELSAERWRNISATNRMVH